jgi:hypothetical protein
MFVLEQVTLALAPLVQPPILAAQSAAIAFLYQDQLYTQQLHYHKDKETVATLKIATDIFRARITVLE